MFNFKLKVDTDKFEQDVLKELKSVIDSKLIKVLPRIYRDCLVLLEVAFQEQPEYNSLLFGQLRSDFGIPNSNDSLNNILNYLKDSIFYRKNQSSIRNGQVHCGFQLGINNKNPAEFFNLGDSGGSPVPWLQWLLTAGDDIVISDYGVVYDPNSLANSRTGLAVMSKNYKGFSVPSEFSGTEDDNFLTRTLSLLTKKIEEPIRNHIYGEF